MAHRTRSGRGGSDAQGHGLTDLDPSAGLCQKWPVAGTAALALGLNSAWDERSLGLLALLPSWWPSPYGATGTWG